MDANKMDANKMSTEMYEGFLMSTFSRIMIDLFYPEGKNNRPKIEELIKEGLTGRELTAREKLVVICEAICVFNTKKMVGL